MTIEEMRRRKKELGFSCRELSERSGVPYGTVEKLFTGATKSPRFATLSRLSEVFEREGRERAKEQDGPDAFAKGTSGGFRYTGSDYCAEPDCVRETGASYAAAYDEENCFREKEQGTYTVEDYLALPDDQRYELIDGVLYDMASPVYDHQQIAGYLYHRLMSCALEHHMPCRPCIAPLDVQLDRDNRTMVQPDVIVICDQSLNIGKRIFGAPEFVAEVLSPSSLRRDLILKLNKYRKAGVKEYWILDPESRTVTVYLFEETTDCRTYLFTDEIPVYISDGICTISMEPILAWLD